MGRQITTETKTGKDVWGPKFWTMLHMASFLYTEDASTCPDEKARMKQFVHAFAAIIPCPVCQQDFLDMINGTCKIDSRKSLPSLDSALRGRRDFSLAVYKWHDAVNQKLDKPASPIFNEIASAYEGATSGHCPAYFTKSIRTMYGTTGCEVDYKRAAPVLIVLLTCAVIGLGTMYSSCRRRCGGKCKA